MFEFGKHVMEKVGFDEKAKAVFTEIAEKLLSDPEHSKTIEKFRGLCDHMEIEDIYKDQIEPLWEPFVEATGFKVEQLTMVVFLCVCDLLYEKYKKHGISDEIFYDTMDDLRCKLNENRERFGYDGFAPRDWLFRFFKLRRFALGRMQYDLHFWSRQPIVMGEKRIFPGDPCLICHIPSSGKPFDREARQDSYRRAVNFFRDRGHGTLPITTTTWLLDPQFIKYMSPKSNIVDFFNDFDVVNGIEVKEMITPWRVFGSAQDLPVEQLPENTTLQRVCKERLLKNDKFYAGSAVLWTDKYVENN